jgi:hypothetical protein
MSRIRTRSVSSFGVAVVQDANGGIINFVPGESEILRETCTDEAGQRDLPFQVDRTSVEGGTGEYTFSGGRKAVFQNFICDYFRTSRPSHLDVGLNYHILAVSLINKTSPFTSDVDLPVFFAELRELPDLVREMGRGLIKKVASGNLSYQFAIAPMVADVKKLLDFTSSIDRRVMRLKRMSSSPTVIKRSLGSFSAQDNSSRIVTGQSNPPLLYDDWRRTTLTTTVSAWGYVKWSPTGALLENPPSNDEIRSAARKAVLGLTVDLATAWELLPWSWLIDWFGNMGDFLENQRNFLDIIPGIPRVCVHSRTEEHWVLHAPGQARDGTIPFVTKRETKLRTFASASFPALQMPVLSGRQMGIAASLFAVRAK